MDVLLQLQSPELASQLEGLAALQKEATLQQDPVICHGIATSLCSHIASSNKQLQLAASNAIAAFASWRNNQALEVLSSSSSLQALWQLVEEQHQARLKEAAEPKPAAPAPAPAKGHKGHKHGKEVPQEQEDPQQGPSKYVMEPLLRTLALLAAYRAEAADHMCSQDPAPLLSLLQQPSDRVKLRAVGLLEALAGRAQGRQYVAGCSAALLQQLLELAGVGTATVQGPLQAASLKLLAKVAQYEGPHSAALLQPSTLAQLMQLLLHTRPKPPEPPTSQAVQPPVAPPTGKGKAGAQAQAVAPAPPPIPPTPLAVTAAAAQLLAVLCGCFPAAADAVAADELLPKVWQRVEKACPSQAMNSTSSGSPTAAGKAGAPAGATAGAVPAQAADTEAEVAAATATLRLLARCAQHDSSRSALCEVLPPAAMVSAVLAFVSPVALSPAAVAQPAPAAAAINRSPTPTGKKAAAAQAAAQAASTAVPAVCEAPQPCYAPANPATARAALMLLVNLLDEPACLSELLLTLPAFGQAALRLLEPAPVTNSTRSQAGSARSSGSGAAPAPLASTASCGMPSQDLAIAAAAAQEAAKAGADAPPKLLPSAASLFDPICQLLLAVAHHSSAAPHLQHPLRQVRLPQLLKLLSQLASQQVGSTAMQQLLGAVLLALPAQLLHAPPEPPPPSPPATPRPPPLPTSEFIAHAMAAAEVTAAG